MKTFVIYLLGILTILAGLTTSNAEVDCNKPPPHLIFESCCEIADVITEEIETKCDTKGISYPHHCFMPCVFNESGILVDGEFQEDNMNTYLNQVYDDSEIVDLFGEAFRKCNEKRESIAIRQSKNRHGHLHCHHNNGQMLYSCIHMHAFKNCPDSVWANSNYCNEAREYYKECDPPME